MCALTSIYNLALNPSYPSTFTLAFDDGYVAPAGLYEARMFFRIQDSPFHIWTSPLSAQRSYIWTASLSYAIPWSIKTKVLSCAKPTFIWQSQRNAILLGQLQAPGGGSNALLVWAAGNTNPSAYSLAQCGLPSGLVWDIQI